MIELKKRRRSETNTEMLFRQILRELGYYDDENIVIEEQDSITDGPIYEILKYASKRGTGNKGKPEFIIYNKNHPELLLVVELKADPDFHNGKEFSPVKYAVDGVLHYMKHLSKHYDVIGIAVSGENKEELKYSSFYMKKNSDDLIRLKHTELHKMNEYIKLYEEFNMPNNKQNNLTQLEIQKLASKLNDYLRSKHLSEEDRLYLLISTLIALKDNAFKASYDKNDTQQKIMNKMFAAIDDVLNSTTDNEYIKNIIRTKLSNIKNAVEFTTTDKIDLNKLDDYPLLKMIKIVDDYLYDLISTENHIDIIGEFYSEFITSANSDSKNLGIVLTPAHITNLFPKIAHSIKGLTPDTKVLDTCAGTGGFLISAVNFLTNNIARNEQEKEQIKRNQIFGIEINDKMFTLLATNMLLRGINIDNLYHNSTFNSDVLNIISKNNIDVVFLNPPYSEEGENNSELDFIENALNYLKPGGLCVAIVPISTATKIKGFETKRYSIMKKHTLVATMKLNVNTFSKIGTHPIIMVWEAHIPHFSIDEKNQKTIRKKTYLANWENDGLVKVKDKPRQDLNNKWSEIESNFLSLLSNFETRKNLAISEFVDYDDEWIIDNFIEPDWETIINKKLFKRNVVKFLQYDFGKVMIGDDDID